MQDVGSCAPGYGHFSGFVLEYKTNVGLLGGVRMPRMLYYCKKCGRVVLNSEGVKYFRCDYCNTIAYPVPEKYWLDGLNFLMTKEQKELLREELVKTSPEYDEYLFSHRDNDLAMRYAKLQGALAHGKAILEGRDKGNPYGIECPYCHATNIKKISSASRAVSTGIFGLGSGRIGKQWHCERCGSDF